MRPLAGLYGLVSDVAKSLLIVAVISGVLFMYSGVWPPLVVVESESMEPNMHVGDIVLMKNVDPSGASTVSTYEQSGDETFGKAGDVVIYDVPNDGRTTPIIHRAMYWVDEGDRLWNGERAASPGYVTKGDNNAASDQRIGITERPVDPSWIKGKAVMRIPYVGYVRLLAGELFRG